MKGGISGEKGWMRVQEGLKECRAVSMCGGGVRYHLIAIVVIPVKTTRQQL